MGRNWAGGRTLLVPLAISATGFALSYGPMTGLRALAAARSSLRARVFDATSTVVLSVSGPTSCGCHRRRMGLRNRRLPEGSELVGASAWRPTLVFIRSPSASRRRHDP